MSGSSAVGKAAYVCGPCMGCSPVFSTLRALSMACWTSEAASSMDFGIGVAIFAVYLHPQANAQGAADLILVDFLGQDVDRKVFPLRFCMFRPRCSRFPAPGGRPPDGMLHRCSFNSVPLSSYGHGRNADARLSDIHRHPAGFRTAHTLHHPHNWARPGQSSSVHRCLYPPGWRRARR